MVERDLAKVDTGVRFPSLAPLVNKNVPFMAYTVHRNGTFFIVFFIPSLVEPVRVHPNRGISFSIVV